ncbi:hypothetical protein CVV65_14660 [Kyrpidia spormannii]|uniref:Abortive phage infection protein C-terminal domain-containing protein n=1 Tax=Kyrpidia spormannii TaxID=2055160 RepID=A0A2K8N9L9_9BACL|nr:AIPR family protein [Kyrpidia spormannii]ATY86014.1 hypothetical protein CVV65_14660 [Kyrpidia spormannii]
MADVTFIDAFRSREDLKIYGNNGLLLFALQLKWNIDDIHAVAAQCLTDGKDDKKCDLVYVDRDRGVAVVAQTHFSSKWIGEAPANKASDLNTAAAWLLTQPIERLPERIRPAAMELRDALQSNQLDTIEFWYVHNLKESQNVKRELITVETTVHNALRTFFGSTGHREVRASEIGSDTIEQWYRDSKAHILVTEPYAIPVPGGYLLETKKWKAYATCIPAKWLHERFKQHNKQLFSANIRDYLGSRRSGTNINNGIKQTAAREPDQFWAFNNGITALVNDLYVEETDEGTMLHIKGISIVNGAQTTGAVGSLEHPPSDEAKVPARFIKCSDEKVIRSIVQFNNTQNEINPADFRSTDAVQDRLRKEFKKFYGDTIEYLGGRRGGEDDTIRRRSNLVPSDTAAQSLASFHQYPDLAYNQKANIWQSNDYYNKFFNDETHADHIIYVYTLHRAISNLKITLQNKGADQLTQSEKEILDFLRYRGSIHIFMSAIGSVQEILLDKPIPTLFLLRFKDRYRDFQSYEGLWQPIVECCLPFWELLKTPLENGLKNRKEIQEAVDQFRNMIQATRRANKSIYDHFAGVVSIDQWDL